MPRIRATFWLRALFYSAWFGVAAGTGLVIGYMAVTLPDEVSTLPDQPGPTWALILGLALGLYGVVVIATAQHRASRQGRRAWSSLDSHGPGWKGEVPAMCAALVGPLILVAAVSTDSAFRAAPLLPAGAAVGFTLWQWLADRSPADE